MILLLAMMQLDKGCVDYFFHDTTPAPTWATDRLFYRPSGLVATVSLLEMQLSWGGVDHLLFCLLLEDNALSLAARLVRICPGVVTLSCLLFLALWARYLSRRFSARC